MSATLNENNKKNGEEKFFHEDGSIKNICYWENGVQQGPAYTYDKQGNLIRKSNLVNGEYQGEQIEYYPSGAIKIKRIYKNDEIVEEQEYDLLGNLKDKLDNENPAHITQMYLLRDKLNASKDEAEFNSIKQELINLIKDNSPKDSSGKHVSIAFIKEGGDMLDGIILSDIKKMSYKKEELDIHDMFIHANILQNKGENNEACALYTYVLELIFKDPGSIQNEDYYVCKPNDEGESNVIPISGVSFNLGKSYLVLNHLNEAKQCFEKSIELNPDNWLHSHHYLGVVKIKLGDFTTCINDFENALKIDENNSDSLYMLGVAYASDNCELQNLEKATKYLTEYLEIKPKDSSALSLINAIKNK